MDYMKAKIEAKDFCKCEKAQHSHTGLDDKTTVCFCYACCRPLEESCNKNAD